MERSVIANLSNRVRLALLLLMFILLIFSLVSCEETQTKQFESTATKVDIERENLQERITCVVRNIDHNLAKLNGIYPGADRELKRWLEMTHDKLQKNKVEANKLLREIRSASEENWEAVSLSALQSLSDIPVSYGSFTKTNPKRSRKE